MNVSSSRVHTAIARAARPGQDGAARGHRLLDPTAQVCLFAEVDGGARLEAWWPPPAAAAELLAGHDRLPSNMRWVRRGVRTALWVDVPPSADAWTEVEAAAALLSVRHHVPPQPPVVVPFDGEALRAALQQAGVAADALIRHPAAVELRLRVADGVRAVRIDACADDWRVECAVLAAPVRVDATLADQALRCNGAVRFARLAWRGDAIAAQARLARSMPVAFLLRSAHAVAALAQHASLPLSTLHEHPEVRAAYARLVSDPTEAQDQGA